MTANEQDNHLESLYRVYARKWSRVEYGDGYKVRFLVGFGVCAFLLLFWPRH